MFNTIRWAFSMLTPQYKLFVSIYIPSVLGGMYYLHHHLGYSWLLTSGLMAIAGFSVSIVSLVFLRLCPVYKDHIELPLYQEPRKRK